jgi:2-keto-3-deoxy-L-rhamnonate aldolase RhmA
MVDAFMDRARAAGRELLGTWVKIPALETVELLAHAGFDFVVVDIEHAALALDRVYDLIFAAQRVRPQKPGSIRRWATRSSW